MISTHQLMFHRETNTFTGDIAELAYAGLPVFERVYPDACDEGIRVVSHVTGQEVMFVIMRIDHDNDNDIQAWHLEPTPEYVRILRSKVPNIAQLSLTIFND